MVENRTKWLRKLSRQRKKICGFQKIKKEIKKSQKQKSGVKGEKIINLLKCSPRFIGCFAEDEVDHLKF